MQYKGPFRSEIISQGCRLHFHVYFGLRLYDRAAVCTYYVHFGLRLYDRAADHTYYVLFGLRLKNKL